MTKPTYKNTPGRRPADKPEDDHQRRHLGEIRDQIGAGTLAIDRVVINAEGEARAPERAAGVTPKLVFVRADGWTLAATHEHAEVAARMWDDHWIAVIDLESRDVTAYFRWKEQQHAAKR